MSKNNNIPSILPARRLLVLTALIASSLFLASCGGGGGSDSTSSAQTADGTKQALGVSGTTVTVPGGWAGRAPKYEVINGITVPPEPAPSINNATLAGVDVNRNGVRDDVERVLARDFSAKHQSAIAFTKNVQKMLTETNPTKETATDLMLKGLCGDLDGQAERDLTAVILNNPQRISGYRALVNAAGVIVISSIPECGK